MGNRDAVRVTLRRLRPALRPQLRRRSFTVVALVGWIATALLCSGAIGNAAGQSLPPKRIYIAPDDHTDFMWKADAATYDDAMVEMLDYYLDLADKTATNPGPYQSRWNCDGNYWVWVYAKRASPANFERLISRIRDGHISVPLNALVSCYGGMPTEAVLRGMYYAGQLERRYGLRLPLVAATENQTLPYGLGALWAGSGGRYSWHGICGYASRVPDAGDRPREAYWWVGPDGSRILMKWNSMLGGNTGMGGYAEARNAPRTVEYVDNDAAFVSRYPYRVIGAFGTGWDDLKTLSPAIVEVTKAMSRPDRPVVVSNQQDFFEDFAATYGEGLPSLSCSFGNEWDLYCASMAETTAKVKRSVERLRGAEALAALVALENPDFMKTREQKRDRAWMDLGLYWEHNWTADGPVSREARGKWEEGLAEEITSYVSQLEKDSIAATGGLIRKEGNAQRFFVFNPLNWNRTDMADVPFDTTGSVHVVDISRDVEVPSQVLRTEGQRRLCILAEDLPAVGYRVYEIRPGDGKAFPNAGTVVGDVIENDTYRIRVAPNGAIRSIIDKQHGNREVVQPSRGRSINDLGGDGSGRLWAENVGPVCVTLAAESSTSVAHTTRITLVRDSRRIDIRNEILQNFDSVLTWDFGFAISHPTTRHEEVGAIVRAALTENGGQYASKNARYDWLTLNHFADMGNEAWGVTLSSADCGFMRLGNSTTEFLDTATPRISVLAGGQVDGPRLGIPKQGGCTHFLQRFSLTTRDAYDTARAMRFALEHQNLPLSGVVTGGNVYPAATYAFLGVSAPNVFLWSLKPPEDESKKGVVLRMWNLSGDPQRLQVSARTKQITSTDRLSHIEAEPTAVQPDGNTFSDSLQPWQIRTYFAGMGKDLN